MNRYVVDDTHTMPKSFSPAVLKCFVNRRQAECFARMNSGVKVGVVNKIERVEVATGRKSVFGPRNIEPDNASITMSNR